MRYIAADTDPGACRPSVTPQTRRSRGRTSDDSKRFDAPPHPPLVLLRWREVFVGRRFRVMFSCDTRLTAASPCRHSSSTRRHRVVSLARTAGHHSPPLSNSKRRRKKSRKQLLEVVLTECAPARVVTTNALTMLFVGITKQRSCQRDEMQCTGRTPLQFWSLRVSCGGLALATHLDGFWRMERHFMQWSETASKRLFTCAPHFSYRGGARLVLERDGERSCRPPLRLAPCKFAQK
jgi:hypothetical protein